MNNMILSTEHLRNKLNELKSKGVKTIGEIKFGDDTNRHFHIILTYDSEFTVAEIIGKIIGYENVRLIKPNNERGDVDVIVKADFQYHIQVKTLNLFDPRSKYGRKIDECVSRDFYRNLDSHKNIYSKKIYVGNKIYQSTNREVHGLSRYASIGVMIFEPSEYEYSDTVTKIQKILFKAKEQLKPFQEEMKVIVIDIRYSHVSEYDACCITLDRLKNFDKHFKEICCVAILSHDFSDATNHFARSRLIPIINNRIQFDTTIFGAKPNSPLFHTRLLSILIKIYSEKGWNELFTLNNGILMIDDVVFGRLL